MQKSKDQVAVVEEEGGEEEEREGIRFLLSTTLSVRGGAGGWWKDNAECLSVCVDVSGGEEAPARVATV